MLLKSKTKIGGDAPINVKPEGGGGGRAWGADFDIFIEKNSNSPPLGQNNWPLGGK